MSDPKCDQSRCKEKGQSGPALDRLFKILADRHRRVLLHHLEKDQPAEVDELAQEMSEYVDIGPPKLTTALHHTHLPKLDELGILDYDPRSETVRYYGHPFLEEALEYTAAEDLGDD